MFPEKSVHNMKILTQIFIILYNPTFLVLAALIYILDTVALITALCVIPMFPDGNPNRIILVVSLIIGGFLFFGILSKIGEKYLAFIVKKKESTDTQETSTIDIGHVNDGLVIESNLQEVENGDHRAENGNIKR